MARTPVINPPDGELTTQLGGVLSSASSCLSSNVSLATDNDLYSGPTLTLAPGTYLVTLNLTLRI